MTTNEGSGLARVQHAGLAMLEPQSFEQLGTLARMVAVSKLFAVQSPEAAVVIMLTGAQLGIPPVAAMRGIHVVEGKAVLSSDLIAAVILRSPACEYLRCVETTAEKCTMVTKRRGQEPAEHTWTLAMAKTAGVVTRGTWAKYPAAMLRARCTAEIGRMVYSDVLFGVYAEDEFDGATSNLPTHEAPADPALVDPQAKPPANPLAEFALDLPGMERLADLTATWGEHSAALNAAEKLTAARDLARTHLETLGYRLTAAEVQACLGGQLTSTYAAWLDLLAAAPRAEDVVVCVRDIPALGESDRDSAKRAAARTVAALRNCTPKQAGEWIAARLHTTDPEPPTGTDAPPAAPPASTSATSTPVATVASAQPSAIVTVDGEALETEAQWRAHLSAMVSPQAVEGSYRRHRDHMAYAALAVQRYMLMRGIHSAETARVALESAARALDNRDARKGAVVALPTPRNVVEGLGIERQRRAVGQ